MKTLVGAVVLLWLAWSPLPTSGQITPPFTQCPPVGADASCAVLIVITDNGNQPPRINVLSDLSQGPFDRIEDTLIGVQNNSSKTVFSLPLGSPTPIFAFDGDGLCAPFTNPKPSGCPFGPTLYEGPGISFSGIASGFGSGTVNIAGGIPPGGSVYFSLELNIQPSCSPISGVPLFKQFSLPWGPMTYDDYPSEDTVDTIKKWGCALTSSVMLTNYHAFMQGKTFRTDPSALNTWLSNPINHGYVGLGNLNWNAVAQYARQNGVQLFFHNISPANDFTVDNFLCTLNPVILQVQGPNGSHFVVATGQTTVSGTSTFLINDPGYSNATLQGYTFQYSSIREFSSGLSIPSAFLIAAHSPIELLVSDSNGLKTGFDSSNGTTLTQIPASSYVKESVGDDENPTGGQTTPPVPSVDISTPLSGHYKVVAMGTGTGDFTIDFLAYDSNGNVSTQTFTGTAAPGVSIVYDVNYSSLPGSQIDVVPVDTTPPNVTVSATPSTLWPPNLKMVPVTISGTIIDPDSGVNRHTVMFSVFDEYGQVQPSGAVTLAAGGRYSFVVLLQAARKGDDKDGRSYTIVVSAKDNAGNFGSASATVIVPHDQGH